MDHPTLIRRNSFQEELIGELNDFLSIQSSRFPEDEILKIDLHCHDHNSDVPDELLGRILNLPETWTGTAQLLETLKTNGCDTVTITNHNNARSCHESRKQGIDVLTGAEFSCTVPDFNIGIHVLTYGFTEEQEDVLKKLRKNLYSFLEYTCQHNLPTIWAHPLYHYHSNGIPPFDFFSKMMLIFERFEVLNGQRDTWQNMLVMAWLQGITPKMIDDTASAFGIDPLKYCRNPYLKAMSGGSDSHMGFFSGLTGTLLHVPGLQEKLLTTSRSELALEALREGRMAPYGSHQNSEKLTVAFLDYVCQIALFRKDPGLLRILLHKGTTRDKIIALLISNGFGELQRHKITMNFIELFHESFQGISPGFTKRWFVPRVYKPVFDDALKISTNKDNPPEVTVNNYKNAIASINLKLNTILYKRLDEKLEKLNKDGRLSGLTLNGLIDHFEIPSELRTLLEKKGNTSSGTDSRMILPDIPELLDGLSFPFLGSALILAAHFTSASVLYNSRSLLTTFSEKIGRLNHPERVLWLTDTFGDHNGVSMVLKSMHEEIIARDLPIDILVCSNTIQPAEHLLVVKPMAEYSLPLYRDQPIRIPNYLDIHHIFHDGEYDRLICSTEGPMGLAALYLKHAYTVPAYFYLHTDWIMFARKVLNLDKSNLNRLRRILRGYYRSFDGLFVLNTDQEKWLTGRSMGFKRESVHLTAHWAEEIFHPWIHPDGEPATLPEKGQVVLFVGRVSREKGVMELPDIYKKVKEVIPGIRFVIAGTGPEENELKEAFPEALYLGWIDHSDLPRIFSAADLLVLPSKFDTFSCVVLESLSCGLPVVAYKTKGPKDIIEDGINGFVVTNQSEMANRIIQYFKNKSMQTSFRKKALVRAKQYAKEDIVDAFLKNIGLSQATL